VLSVATVGLELGNRQRSNWGSHPRIRHFEVVHQGHHEAYGNETCTDLRKQADECENEKIEIPADANGRRKYVAPGVDIPGIGGMFRDKSEGRMCAQRRQVIGLHSLYAERYSNNSDYPDWLLVVDDDTEYKMDIFCEAVKNANSDEVHVLVGYPTPYYNWPYGGFGSAFSRRLLPCRRTTTIYTPILSPTSNRP
jgi:hypothetical protein